MAVGHYSGRVFVSNKVQGYMKTGVRTLYDITDMGLKNIDDNKKFGIGNIDDLKNIGIRDIDDLLKAGVRNPEDLLKLGVKNLDDLAELGISSLDDLSRIGIKNADDLTRLGIKNADEVFNGLKGAGGARTSKPNQLHHYASNKNQTYTPQFEEVAKKYGLDLDGDWNKELLPHQGRHPNNYHEYILENMKQFDNIAQGDRNIFLQLYENLKKNVASNPDMLYKDFWNKK